MHDLLITPQLTFLLANIKHYIVNGYQQQSTIDNFVGCVVNGMQNKVLISK